jgi:hypothetical protein
MIAHFHPRRATYRMFRSSNTVSMANIGERGSRGSLKTPEDSEVLVQQYGGELHVPPLVIPNPQPVSWKCVPKCIRPEEPSAHKKLK